MVARYWSARARPDTGDRYLRHFTDHVLPSLQQIDGFVSATVLRRTVGRSIEIVVTTYWRSLDDIRRFAGDDIEIAVVTDEAASLFVDYDRRVRHYEVVHPEP